MSSFAGFLVRDIGFNAYGRIACFSRSKGVRKEKYLFPFDIKNYKKKGFRCDGEIDAIKERAVQGNTRGRRQFRNKAGQ